MSLLANDTYDTQLFLLFGDDAGVDEAQQALAKRHSGLLQVVYRWKGAYWEYVCGDQNRLGRKKAICTNVLGHGSHNRLEGINGQHIGEYIAHLWRILELKPEQLISFNVIGCHLGHLDLPEQDQSFLLRLSRAMLDAGYGRNMDVSGYKAEVAVRADGIKLTHINGDIRYRDQSRKTILSISDAGELRVITSAGKGVPVQASQDSLTFLGSATNKQIATFIPSREQFEEWLKETGSNTDAANIDEMLDRLDSLKTSLNASEDFEQILEQFSDTAHVLDVYLKENGLWGEALSPNNWQAADRASLDPFLRLWGDMMRGFARFVSQSRQINFANPALNIPALTSTLENAAHFIDKETSEGRALYGIEGLPALSDRAFATLSEYAHAAPKKKLKENITVLDSEVPIYRAGFEAEFPEFKLTNDLPNAPALKRDDLLAETVSLVEGYEDRALLRLKVEKISDTTFPIMELESGPAAFHDSTTPDMLAEISQAIKTFNSHMLKVHMSSKKGYEYSLVKLIDYYNQDVAEHLRLQATDLAQTVSAKVNRNYINPSVSGSQGVQTNLSLDYAVFSDPNGYFESFWRGGFKDFAHNVRKAAYKLAQEIGGNEAPSRYLTSFLVQTFTTLGYPASASIAFDKTINHRNINKAKQIGFLFRSSLHDGIMTILSDKDIDQLSAWIGAQEGDADSIVFERLKDLLKLSYAHNPSWLDRLETDVLSSQDFRDLRGVLQNLFEETVPMREKYGRILLPDSSKFFALNKETNQLEKVKIDHFMMNLDARFPIKTKDGRYSIVVEQRKLQEYSPLSFFDDLRHQVRASVWSRLLNFVTSDDYLDKSEAPLSTEDIAKAEGTFDTNFVIMLDTDPLTKYWADAIEDNSPDVDTHVIHMREDGQVMLDPNDKFILQFLPRNARINLHILTQDASASQIKSEEKISINIMNAYRQMGGSFKNLSTVKTTISPTGYVEREFFSYIGKYLNYKLEDTLKRHIPYSIWRGSKLGDPLPVLDSNKKPIFESEPSKGLSSAHDAQLVLLLDDSASVVAAQQALAQKHSDLLNIVYRWTGAEWQHVSGDEDLLKEKNAIRTYALGHGKENRIEGVSGEQLGESVTDLWKVLQLDPSQLTRLNVIGCGLGHLGFDQYDSPFLADLAQSVSDGGYGSDMAFSGYKAAVAVRADGTKITNDKGDVRYRDQTRKTTLYVDSKGEPLFLNSSSSGSPVLDFPNDLVFFDGSGSTADKPASELSIIMNAHLREVLSSRLNGLIKAMDSSNFHHLPDEMPKDLRDGFMQTFDLIKEFYKTFKVFSTAIKHGIGIRRSAGSSELETDSESLWSVDEANQLSSSLDAYQKAMLEHTNYLRDVANEYGIDLTGDEDYSELFQTITDTFNQDMMDAMEEVNDAMESLSSFGLDEISDEEAEAELNEILGIDDSDLSDGGAPDGSSSGSADTLKSEASERDLDYRVLSEEEVEEALSQLPDVSSLRDPSSASGTPKIRERVESLQPAQSSPDIGSVQTEEIWFIDGHPYLANPDTGVLENVGIEDLSRLPLTNEQLKSIRESKYDGTVSIDENGDLTFSDLSDEIDSLPDDTRPDGARPADSEPNIDRNFAEQAQEEMDHFLENIPDMEADGTSSSSSEKVSAEIEEATAGEGVAKSMMKAMEEMVATMVIMKIVETIGDGIGVASSLIRASMIDDPAVREQVMLDTLADFASSDAPLGIGTMLEADALAHYIKMNGAGDRLEIAARALKIADSLNLSHQFSTTPIGTAASILEFVDDYKKSWATASDAARARMVFGMLSSFPIIGALAGFGYMGASIADIWTSNDRSRSKGEKVYETVTSAFSFVPILGTVISFVGTLFDKLNSKAKKEDDRLAREFNQISLETAHWQKINAGQLYYNTDRKNSGFSHNDYSFYAFYAIKDGESYRSKFSIPFPDGGETLDSEGFSFLDPHKGGIKADHFGHFTSGYEFYTRHDAPGLWSLRYDDSKAFTWDVQSYALFFNDGDQNVITASLNDIVKTGWGQDHAYTGMGGDFADGGSGIDSIDFKRTLGNYLKRDHYYDYSPTHASGLWQRYQLKMNGGVTYRIQLNPTKETVNPDRLKIDGMQAVSQYVYKVIYKEDFEGDDPLEGWSHNTFDLSWNSMNHFGRFLGNRKIFSKSHKTHNSVSTRHGLTRYLGRFANETSSVSKTFYIQDSEKVRVSFDFYAIDSWDKEHFKVYVNDTLLFDDVYDYNDFSIASRRTDGNLYAGWGSEFINNYSFDVTLDYSGQLKLRFESTLDESIHNESWGIDNLVIKDIMYEPSTIIRSSFATVDKSGHAIFDYHAKSTGEYLFNILSHGSNHRPDPYRLSIYSFNSDVLFHPDKYKTVLSPSSSLDKTKSDGNQFDLTSHSFYLKGDVRYKLSVDTDKIGKTLRIKTPSGDEIMSKLNTDVDGSSYWLLDSSESGEYFFTASSPVQNPVNFSIDNFYNYNKIDENRAAPGKFNKIGVQLASRFESMYTDFSADIHTEGRASVDTNVYGIAHGKNDADYYKIDLVSGQGYCIMISGTSQKYDFSSENHKFAPHIYGIYDKDGKLVSDKTAMIDMSYNGPRIILPFRPSVSGEYYVSVGSSNSHTSSNNNDARGYYQFSVLSEQKGGKYNDMTASSTLYGYKNEAEGDVITDWEIINTTDHNDSIDTAASIMSISTNDGDDYISYDGLSSNIWLNGGADDDKGDILNLKNIGKGISVSEKSGSYVALRSQRSFGTYHAEEITSKVLGNDAHRYDLSGEGDFRYDLTGQGEARLLTRVVFDSIYSDALIIFKDYNGRVLNQISAAYAYGRLRGSSSTFHKKLEKFSDLAVELNVPTEVAYIDVRSEIPLDERKLFTQYYDPLPSTERLFDIHQPSKKIHLNGYLKSDLENIRSLATDSYLIGDYQNSLQKYSSVQVFLERGKKYFFDVESHKSSNGNALEAPLIDKIVNVNNSSSTVKISSNHHDGKVHSVAFTVDMSGLYFVNVLSKRKHNRGGYKLSLSKDTHKPSSKLPASLTIKGVNGAGHSYKAVASNFETIIATDFDDNIVLSDSLGINDVIAGDGDDIVIGNAAKNNLIGNGGDDVIHGRAGDDKIQAGPGNDKVTGGLGHDEIAGGDGLDVLHGNEGDDTLTGNSGKDQIFGGKGADIIFGGDGIDVLYGNEGDDLISGGEGSDSIFAGAGNDKILGNAGHDVIAADAGDDHVIGGDGNDLITLGKGNDTAFGSGGNDIISGNDGADKIYGGSGNDKLYGDDGNDILAGADGIDILDGGAGFDFADYRSAKSGVNIDLNKNKAISDGYGHSDSLKNIEGVLTGDYNDTVRAALNRSLQADLGLGDDTAFGSQHGDRIDGQGGNDMIAGGSGNDVLIGGDGRDILQGDGGDDFLSGGRGSDQLYGVRGTNKIYGGAGADYIYGGNEDDLLSGGLGDDTLQGAQGNNLINGGEGYDIALYNSSYSDMYFYYNGKTLYVDTGSGTDELQNIEQLKFVDGGTDKTSVVLNFSGSKNGSVRADLNNLPSDLGNKKLSYDVDSKGISLIDISTGEKLWSVSQADLVDVVALEDNILLAAKADGTLYRITPVTNDIEKIGQIDIARDKKIDSLLLDSYGNIFATSGNNLLKVVLDKEVLSPIKETFDSGASGWSKTETHKDDTLGVTLGRFGANEYVTKTYDIDSRYSGRYVWVDVDMHEIGAWDHQAFYAQVNGSQVAFAEFYEQSGANDITTHHYRFKAEVVDNKVTLKFGTKHGSGSWSIDNVELTGNDRLVTTDVGKLDSGDLAGDTALVGDDLYILVEQETPKDSDKEYHYDLKRVHLDNSIFLVKDDFEERESYSSSTYKGWNSDRIINSEFLGNFMFLPEQSGAILQKTYDIDSRFKKVKIQFSFYEIGQWENEEFNVHINGSISDRKKYSFSNDDGGVKLKTTDFPTEIHYYSLEADVVDGKVELGFSSILPDSKSWGIDNVVIYGLQDLEGDHKDDTLYSTHVKTFSSDTAFQGIFSDSQGNLYLKSHLGISSLDDPQTLIAHYDQTPGSGEIRGAGKARESLIDSVIGSTRSDTLIGDSRDNLLVGLDGNDTLDGGAGDDTILGGAGDDVIKADRGNDKIDGDEGIDTLRYDDLHTTQHWTDGNAIVVDLTDGTGKLVNWFSPMNIADAKLDTIRNIENIVGTNGNDLIKGDEADNTFMGLLGNDKLDGGGGVDTVSYSQPTEGAVRVRVNLYNRKGIYTSIASSPDGSDVTYVSTLNKIENVIGTAGDDILIGDSHSNELFGGAGNDELSGGLGDDILHGGLGLDSFDGGLGNDTVSYSAFSTNDGAYVVANLGTGRVSLRDKSFIPPGLHEKLVSIENIIGSDGNDILTGDYKANILSGSAGNDRLHGFYGDDTLKGGYGIDSFDGGFGIDTVDYGDAFETEKEYIDLDLSRDRAILFKGDEDNGRHGTETIKNVENAVGSSGNDIMRGDSGANSLSGGAGNDKLYGGAGNDTIIGGEGADTLSGGHGDDTIFGGGGNDTFIASAGKDIYHFGFGDGNDIFTADSKVGGDNDIFTADSKVGGDIFGKNVDDDIPKSGSEPDVNNLDVFIMQDDIKRETLWFEKDKTDLVVGLHGSEDTITLQGWYDQDSLAQHVRGITVEGELLDHNDINRLVLAMASFDPSDGTTPMQSATPKLSEGVMLGVSSGL